MRGYGFNGMFPSLGHTEDAIDMPDSSKKEAIEAKMEEYIGQLLAKPTLTPGEYDVLSNKLFKIKQEEEAFIAKIKQEAKDECKKDSFFSSPASLYLLMTMLGGIK